MSAAEERAAYINGLQKLVDAMRADESIPLPVSCWAMPFRAADAAGLDCLTRSLGIEDGDADAHEEEDGSVWYRLRGHVRGVLVEVTADAGPLLLDPLTDEGLVDRFSLSEVAR